MTKMG